VWSAGISASELMQPVASDKHRAPAVAAVADNAGLRLRTRRRCGVTRQAQRQQHYNKGRTHAATLMRYFFSLALTKAALALGIGMTPAPGCAIASRRATLRLSACHLGAAVEAIDMTVVAVLADEHLAMTAGTVVHPG